MPYIHLTDDEGYHICEAKVEGLTVREIARRVGRDKSTISRELHQGRGERGYRPAQAIRKQRKRAANRANGPRVGDAVRQAAKAKLQEEWSPEQISGRFRLAGAGNIRHETIYQRIYFDNGLEFAGYEGVTRCVGAGTYFARPYHFWGRGRNENTNVLVRQY